MKRKAVKIIAAVLAVFVAGAGAFAVADAVAKNKYWSSPLPQELITDTRQYSAYLSSIDSDLSETEDKVVECNARAVPLPDECSSFIAECNKIIIKYFNDVHSVDLSEKINSLRVMSSTYPAEISDSVGGSYYGEIPELADKLFINSTLFDGFIKDASGTAVSVDESELFNVKMLRAVYIHETIHYIGFSNDPLLDHFGEALTECLNERVITHSGIKYENITGYSRIKSLASQIVEADPEIVRCVLLGESTVGEHFNQTLGGNYADAFDDLVFIVQNDFGNDYADAAFLAQLTAYEYAKAATSNARVAVKNADPSIVKFFELKWLLG